MQSVRKITHFAIGKKTIFRFPFNQGLPCGAVKNKAVQLYYFENEVMINHKLIVV